jgi:hypothetical protein
MSERATADAMSDDDFLNHVLWLVVDGAEALPGTRKRAAALAMSRCKASYAQARGDNARALVAARRAAALADADGGCTPEFPCRRCTDCDAAERSHLASFVIPTPRS